jgi:O-glycosyl hydrolase
MQNVQAWTVQIGGMISRLVSSLLCESSSVTILMTQWYMDNMYDQRRALCHIIDFTTHRFIGAVENNAKSALMWNLALDPQGSPKYPGTSSCKEGCRGVVTIYPDGTWVVNQECMSAK